MELEWWHWLVLGLALGLAELAIPSFFIIWFGLGALVVGLALLVVTMSVTAQFALWTAASVILTILWFRVFRHQVRQTRSGQADEVIGEVGVLVAAVEPFQRGQVRFQKPLMGSETWPCIADTQIAAGERVRVAAVDGQLLKVIASGSSGAV